MTQQLSDAEEIARLRAHVAQLQLIGMKVLEDWWPLVYDRTCRQTVKRQAAEMRDAIEGIPHDPAGV